ncbi:hypothetical protein BDP27DRAFT_1362779 [Rhodocollybia butyracea]|uniref:Uncharacterized protein n=1 Tax=Rhodocollybia butyracea TaxID=206335 RepID=A0A9P5U7R3_9AGAR|nr:hypothetical protein BDP27DRAFT_1362779 [Rhodocollybia butyracea]
MYFEWISLPVAKLKSGIDRGHAEGPAKMYFELVSLLKLLCGRVRRCGKKGSKKEVKNEEESCVKEIKLKVICNFWESCMRTSAECTFDSSDLSDSLAWTELLCDRGSIAPYYYKDVLAALTFSCASQALLDLWGSGSLKINGEPEAGAGIFSPDSAELNRVAIQISSELKQTNQTGEI